MSKIVIELHTDAEKEIVKQAKEFLAKNKKTLRQEIIDYLKTII